MKKQYCSLKMAQAIFVLSVFFASFATAQEGDPAADLNALLSKLETLQVSFKLEIRNQSDNELLDENSGTLTLKRPGYFHVHTLEPFEQYLISDRKTIWTYDVDLEQATSEAVDDRLQQTPFLLLSGDVEAIKQNFKVQAPTVNGDKKAFSLSPIDKTASYDNVVLNFESGLLMGMSWTNTLDEQNSIAFSNIVSNKPTSNELFTFVPPQGVLVINGSEQIPVP